MVGTRIAEEMLRATREGVIVLNEYLTPVRANPAAIELLGIDPDLPPRLPDRQLESIARRAGKEGTPIEETLELWQPDRRILRVTAQPGPEQGIIVLLKDVSDEMRAVQVRRQFVAHASHELKTPVAGIQALAEALVDAVEHDSSRIREFAQRLRDEASRLGGLIGDLLDLSRLEEPTSIANRRLDLNEVARIELETARVAAATKDVEITADLENGCTVRGDERLLSLMIRNLLDNAVQYTDVRGSIRLTVAKDDADVEVRVQDDGVGIPLAAQSRVFERFFRVDEGRSRDQGGTGLGLAIVKHVAELHGGNVQVNSQLGEGSTFIARIKGAPASEDES